MKVMRTGAPRRDERRNARPSWSTNVASGMASPCFTTGTAAAPAAAAAAGKGAHPVFSSASSQASSSVTTSVALTRSPGSRPFVRARSRHPEGHHHRGHEALDLFVAHGDFSSVGGDGQDLPGEREAPCGRFAAAPGHGHAEDGDEQEEADSEEPHVAMVLPDDICGAGYDAQGWIPSGVVSAPGRGRLGDDRTWPALRRYCIASSAILCQPQWKPPLPARVVPGR